MKTTFLLLAVLFTTSLFAQTTTIYGKVTKSDGIRVKGTSTYRGYEDQLIITNLAGGVDHTALIELEVPTSGYVGTFRNMMNTAPTQIVAVKAATTINLKSAATALAAIPAKTITTPLSAVFPISRIDISITSRTNNQMPILTRQIILEDVNVESCTDDIASGTSKIKFKANRIGWIYNNWGVDGKLRSTDKSGWDVVKGTAWTNF
ncbi:hypothetical protein DBR40_18310 [Pedobacter sp. KBW01]|uniref:hypothetical protein n=1 Tax=Pedobacter sp. KBW01 TaxID=2153364 RepID=UPI000F5B6A37|nr:hypothetical protein [Pedobacter sp. KBW01]RQO68940.1 hypothetical protein DBR40_18310 [Pedobacter sp. KBW01]